VNVGLLLLWQRLVEQQQRQIDDAVKPRPTAAGHGRVHIRT
jgi:hypothetical protein